MSKSIVGKILSLAGLVGSTPTNNSIIPASRFNPAAQDDFDKAGEIENPDIWSSYNSAMSRPRTLEEQLRIWDEMAHWDLMAAALTEFTDEATQKDASSPGLIWYECSNKQVEEELNTMLDNIDADTYVPSQVYFVAGFGNQFEKLDYSLKEGVKGFSAIHPLEIRRYWLRRNRKCVGFRWQGNIPRKDDVFTIGNIQIPRSALNHTQSSGSSTLEELWYPWDILHFRRMYRARQTEHGEPLFEEAQGIYRKLRIAIDQMTVCRAQIQPDRLAINIDTQDSPPIEQMKIIQRWKHMFRTKMSFGSGASGISGEPDDYKSFYNPMALDTVLWLPKPRGYAHTIDRVAGTSSIPDVHDIELLTNLFFSIIGMPKSWIGLKGAGGEGAPASGKALLAQDMRFLRKVKSIRNPILAGYEWLGYFHCMLRGHDVSSLEITAHMPPIGSLEDQIKIEILDKQADILDKLADTMPKFGLPKEAWIDVVFRRYLNLPDEIIDAFLTSLPAEKEPQPMESNYGKEAKKQIAEELFNNLNKSQITSDFNSLRDGQRPKRARKMTKEKILSLEKPTQDDLVVSGFGQLDPLTDFNPTPHKNVTERLIEGQRPRANQMNNLRYFMDIHKNRR